jgi:ATP-binding cassette subfamily G (WHITE) protein 2
MDDLQRKDLRLAAAYVAPQVDLDAGLERPRLPREITPWGHQFRVLFHRTMIDCARGWPLLAIQLSQSVVVAVFIGTAFLHIGSTETSIVRRQPVLFFCVVNQGVFSSLVVINSFPRDRVLMLRERAAGTYYASAYYLAKTGAETLLSWVNPIVFSARCEEHPLSVIRYPRLRSLAVCEAARLRRDMRSLALTRTLVA